MRRIRRTVVGTLLAAGTLLTAGMQAATAQADPAPPAAAAVSRTAAVSAAEQRQVIDFWTPERMRSATPLDLRVPVPTTAPAPRGCPTGLRGVATPGTHARGVVVSRRCSAWTPSSALRSQAPDAAPSPTATHRTPPRPGARPTTVAPTSPSLGIASFPQAGGAWTGGGAVVKTSGRVFFTFDGRTASCSGNAVTSQNASTVITAGHCVKYQGNWHTNWVFVPGYHDGQTPYGTWTASKTLSTPQWVASEDINYDVGAAVVNPQGGQKLTEVVGAQGLQFNGGYNKPMYAFGFPAASPYDGSKLIYCSGNTSKDFLLSKDHGMACNMTGGSSGGPWFASFDEATGTGLQSSVNSFGYNFLPNRMFGPYFGDEAKNLYQQAQAT